MRLRPFSFVLFALMWAATVVQSPGGMSALAHEVAAVEQQLRPPMPQSVQTSGADGEQGFDIYPGGIICEETTVEGEPAAATSCRAPAGIFLY